jgi:hypothetical protein
MAACVTAGHPARKRTPSTEACILEWRDAPRWYEHILGQDIGRDNSNFVPAILED